MFRGWSLRIGTGLLTGIDRVEAAWLQLTSLAERPLIRFCVASRAARPCCPRRQGL